MKHGTRERSVRFCRYVVLLLLISVVLAGCKKKHPDIDDIDMTPISTLKGIEGREIIVEVIRGEGWEHTYRKGIWPVKVAPQFALWSEDGQGVFIDTLYVTHKSAKQFWRNTEEKAGEVSFQEALPRWMHVRRSAGLAMPTRLMPLPDTVTSATPSNNAVIYTRVPQSMSEVCVMLEINLAHDGNAAFPDHPAGSRGYAGASGQPALVYGVKIDPRVAGKYEMKLLGHSSPSGADGRIYEDVSGVTTARQIVRDVYVICQD